MSAAALAGMRLKLFWLWFISASYAQTLFLLYKHRGEFFHLCGIVEKWESITQTVIYSWTLAIWVLKIRLNLTHICSQKCKRGRAARLWSEE